MARRNTNLFEDVFKTLVQLHWGFGTAFVFIFLFMGAAVTSGLGSDPIMGALSPYIYFIFVILAVLSGAAAVVSAVRSLSNSRLLDTQSDLESLRRLSWREFEDLVGEAYRRRGYGVEKTGGGGADGGVDLILRKNNEKTLVQCKRWKTYKVGVDKVRELFGVVTAENADRGILVTCGRFTKEALAFQSGKPLTLIDGQALVQLVLNVQKDKPSSRWGAAPSETTCPICGSDMVLRTARRGANAGKDFLGCASFPKCRGTRQIN